MSLKKKKFIERIEEEQMTTQIVNQQLFSNLRMDVTDRYGTDTYRDLNGWLKWIDRNDAEVMLASSIGNRPVNTHMIDRLSRDMNQKEYFSALLDPILFTRNNELLDGHHRLQTVIATDKPQPFLCIYGYDASDYIFIDQGAKRTLANNLHVKGRDSTGVRAPSIRMLFRLLHNKFGKQRVSVGALDADRIDELFPNLQSSINYAKAKKDLLSIPASVIATLKTLYDLYDEDKSKEFWEGLVDGKHNAWMYEHDPRRWLRFNVSTDDSLTKATPRFYKNDVYLFIVHFAWVNFYNDEPLTDNPSKEHYQIIWSNLSDIANEVSVKLKNEESIL